MKVFFLKNWKELFIKEYFYKQFSSDSETAYLMSDNSKRSPMAQVRQIFGWLKV